VEQLMAAHLALHAGQVARVLHVRLQILIGTLGRSSKLD
jgi:hypothetical protein